MSDCDSSKHIDKVDISMSLAKQELRKQAIQQIMEEYIEKKLAMKSEGSKEKKQEDQ